MVETISRRPQTVDYELEVHDLVDGSFSDRKDVAFLHSALLPRSPVVKLGYPFMTKYYYYHLVRDGLIGCHLARVNGKPAGFVSFTNRPHDFMAAGLRNHIISLTPVVAHALVTRPSRVAVVARALGMLKRRRDDLASGPIFDGEILSLAVLPQYRSAGFIRHTGQNIARRLFDIAVARTRQAGAHTLVTLAQARDQESLFFFHAVGCRFHREWIDGADCYEITYDISEESSIGRASVA